MIFRKTVVSVDGNKVTVDEAMPHSIDPTSGGGTAWPCEWSSGTRITEVGVEFITFLSAFSYNGKFGTEDAETATLDVYGDENHARFAIYLDNSEHVWIRNVTTKHFWMGAILTDDGASHTTIIDASSIDPVSVITGGRRYGFNTEGDTNLFFRCYVRHGRHDFVTGSLAVGPNVWADSVSDKSYSDIGPHHRYAVGQLYDSIVGATFRAWNRHCMGSGHGWSGVNIVFW